MKISLLINMKCQLLLTFSYIFLFFFFFFFAEKSSCSAEFSMKKVLLTRGQGLTFETICENLSSHAQNIVSEVLEKILRYFSVDG